MVAELALIYLAVQNDMLPLLIVFGPLIVLLTMLGWKALIRGIRCPCCKERYGVSVNMKTWITIPYECRSCGTAERTFSKRNLS
ncbi:hypothetical protein DV711_05705 [Motiliproteus coralliicola]|uniref:Uncharacterized protein n=1 Tax=Motiliproteus coralliicola TaxID=2283196 RepID=A0A369WTQ7_9GAMM|nr:hypothetical protein DV711_05705 [Motiliproteus coralliicola]